MLSKIAGNRCSPSSRSSSDANQLVAAGTGCLLGMSGVHNTPLTHAHLGLPSSILDGERSLPLPLGCAQVSIYVESANTMVESCLLISF